MNREDGGPLLPLEGELHQRPSRPENLARNVTCRHPAHEAAIYPRQLVVGPELARPVCRTCMQVHQGLETTAREGSAARSRGVGTDASVPAGARDSISRSPVSVMRKLMPMPQLSSERCGFKRAWRSMASPAFWRGFHDSLPSSSEGSRATAASGSAWRLEGRDDRAALQQNAMDSQRCPWPLRSEAACMHRISPRAEAGTPTPPCGMPEVTSCGQSGGNVPCWRRSGATVHHSSWPACCGAPLAWRVRPFWPFQGHEQPGGQRCLGPPAVARSAA